MRTDEVQNTIRELLNTLPGLAVDYRRMAGRLAELSRKDESLLSLRCEKADSILNLIHSLSIGDRSLVLENTPYIHPDVCIELREWITNSGSLRRSMTTIRNLPAPPIGPRLKNGQFFSHRAYS